MLPVIALICTHRSALHACVVLAYRADLQIDDFNRLNELGKIQLHDTHLTMLYLHSILLL